MRFIPKGIRVRLEDNPRKGICSLCHKKIGDSYINYKGILSTIKVTHMHHTKYDPDNISKHTIEVCNSCHAKMNKKHKN